MIDLPRHNPGRLAMVRSSVASLTVGMMMVAIAMVAMVVMPIVGTIAIVAPFGRQPPHGPPMKADPAAASRERDRRRRLIGDWRK